MCRTKAIKNHTEVHSTSVLILSKLTKIQQTVDETNTECLIDQNKVIVDLLSEVHVLVKSNLGPAMVSNKYLDHFSIETEKELEDMEFEISNETKDAIGATIKNIVGKDGIRKKLTDMLYLH